MSDHGYGYEADGRARAAGYGHAHDPYQGQDAYGADLERGGVAGAIHRFFGGPGQTVIGIACVLFSIIVFGFVARDWMWSNTVHKSGLERISALRWNERTLAFPIAGVDNAGRRAVFDVVVLTKDYGWVRGSTTELERDGRRLSAAEIEREILAPQLRENLRRAQQLIAVGLASQEGEVAREEQRAGLRAARIAEWVAPAVPNLPMSTLNLGRYLDVCQACEDGDTSWQRPFIVIAVKRADTGTNISEALRDGMSNKSNLPSPDRYSRFAMARFVR